MPCSLVCIWEHIYEPFNDSIRLSLKGITSTNCDFLISLNQLFLSSHTPLHSELHPVSSLLIQAMIYLVYLRILQTETCPILLISLSFSASLIFLSASLLGYPCPNDSEKRASIVFSRFSVPDHI